jgi:uncharacterized protein involved in exopolysaccharide biosynthesis
MAPGPHSHRTAAHPERFVTSTVNEELDSRLNRINNQVQAYDVLARIIEEFNLYPEDRAELAEEEVIEKMRAHISVALVAGLTADRGNTTAFRVSFRDSRPDHVAQVANRLANTFVDENKRSRNLAAEGTASFINTQIQDAQNALSRAEELDADRQRYMGSCPNKKRRGGDISAARLNIRLPKPRSWMHQAKCSLRTI